MADAKGPSLTLEEPPGRLKKKSPGKGLAFGLVVVVLLQAVVIAILLRSPARSETESGSLPAKDWALALETRGLVSEAATRFEDWLATHPDDPDRSKIAYRIGKLLMDADKWEEAASYFVLSELWASADDQAPEARLGQRLVECLRRAGLDGAVGRELARRVDHSGEGGEDPVLATWAGEEFRESDLERLIEGEVDAMLRMREGWTPSDREALLANFRDVQTRRSLLEGFLVQDLMVRRARELGVDQEDVFLKLRERQERQLLASILVEREQATIKPTDTDLEAHYKANEELWKEPGSIDVRVAELTSEDDIEELASMAREDFDSVLEGRQPDSGTERKVVAGRSDPILGSVFGRLQGKKGGSIETIESAGVRYLVRVERVHEGVLPSFEEAKDRVVRDYIARKRRELEEALGRRLLERYEVRILAPPPQEEGS